MNDLLNKIAENFRRFPGIGPRQAKRFVYYLLHQGASEIDALIKSLEQLKKSVARCGDCQRYFPLNNFQPTKLCANCQDPMRDESTLLVVEKDVDLENVERSGTYHGRYFILGGGRNGTDADALHGKRLMELKRQIADEYGGRVDEIVLALNPTAYGDIALESIVKDLQPFAVAISQLGRGIPMGGEIEFADEDTLREALKRRS